MKPSPPLSRAAAASVAVLGALGYLGGWLILLSGGFHHAHDRYTRQTTFVSGAPALFMAALSFTLAAIGMAALLQLRKSTLPGHLAGCCAVLLPPLLYLMTH